MEKFFADTVELTLTAIEQPEVVRNIPQQLFPETSPDGYINALLRNFRG